MPKARHAKSKDMDAYAKIVLKFAPVEAMADILADIPEISEDSPVDAEEDLQ